MGHKPTRGLVPYTGDAALKQVDLLVMPTLPLKATLLPPPNASREEYVACALEMLANTCPFDVTGHPAITSPRECPKDSPWE